MPIPKIIHQTFRTSDLPLLTRWHISRFRKRNPDYMYEFYDDNRIEDFLRESFGRDILSGYLKLNIGAAKADFFRYAVLYKKGGVYLDIDSDICGSLDDFIRPDDHAIISAERNPGLLVQWALVFEPKHPFLEKTMALIMDNISHNRYPNDVHQMTGPSVFTHAVSECIAADPSVSYRKLGTDYEGHFKFKYPLGKLLLYQKGGHWKQQQRHTPVLKP
ncbi:glycosyltransferase [Pedobacter sp. JY14-1]|uniref:glycosyltransferase family 32 protein n=1 Tax=Pedobacter sp. JY14-1 TaxID=3034151 RepID=UPI0023E2F93F|nr:glycosyltransferase [Pedobacter sp. JY14-1]